MTKISLRAYNKEIEQLLEQNLIPEAIDHCRFILHFYPKHFQTYRLLGKAYLELQQFDQASDIFKRVLSVIPNDFIAHIALSIIRESEKYIEAAIWHMERAFESQPSNLAVQDEIRRLIEIRDGQKQERVPLTRGALIRMYSRGNLTTQAIAEARAALNEEPGRLDLEVILANLLYSSNDIQEAIQLSEKLSTTLPYCLIANQVLFNLLPSVSREKDAINHKRVLIELDPYATFLSTDLPSSDFVPEQLVTIEKYTSISKESGNFHSGLVPITSEDLVIPNQPIDHWLGGITSYNEIHQDWIPEQLEEGSSSLIEESERMKVEPIAEGNNGIEQPKTLDQVNSDQRDAEIPDSNQSGEKKLSEIFSDNLETEKESKPTFTLEELELMGISSVGLSEPQTENQDSIDNLDEVTFNEIGKTPEWVQEIEYNASIEENGEFPAQEQNIRADTEKIIINDDEIVINHDTIEDPPKPQDEATIESNLEYPEENLQEEDTGLEQQVGSPVVEIARLEDLEKTDQPDKFLGDLHEDTSPTSTALIVENKTDNSFGGDKSELSQPDEIPDRDNESDDNELLDLGIYDSSESSSLADRPVENEPEEEGFSKWLSSTKVNNEIPPNKQNIPGWMISGKPSDRIQLPDVEDLLVNKNLLVQDETDFAPDSPASERVEGSAVFSPGEDFGSKETDPLTLENQPKPDSSIFDDLSEKQISLENPKLTEEFEQAQVDISQSNISRAIDRYRKLIKTSKNLKYIIHNLEAAVKANPENIPLLQTLGDAYVKAERLQDALDVYTKAEKLLENKIG